MVKKCQLAFVLFLTGSLLFFIQVGQVKLAQIRPFEVLHGIKAEQFNEKNQLLFLQLHHEWISPVLPFTKQGNLLLIQENPKQPISPLNYSQNIAPSKKQQPVKTSKVFVHIAVEKFHLAPLNLLPDLLIQLILKQKHPSCSENTTPMSPGLSNSILKAKQL